MIHSKCLGAILRDKEKIQSHVFSKCTSGLSKLSLSVLDVLSLVRVAWNEPGCVLETAELGQSLHLGAGIA